MSTRLTVKTASISRQCIHRQAHLLWCSQQRRLQSSKVQKNSPNSTSPQPQHEPPRREPIALTKFMERNAWSKAIILKIFDWTGLRSPKNMAPYRCFHIYERFAATKPDADKIFWQEECLLPPTFQTWFTVTNLHIWLLTVRFRALPQPVGRAYIQSLIDHFFEDIEDRMRFIMQPRLDPPEPYTFHTTFYVNPNAPSAEDIEKKKRPSRAPERLITRHMKIFREQWAGLQASLDRALTRNDMETAGAVYRNFLGARGARGIALPGEEARFRRTANPYGSQFEKVEKIEEDEGKDDGSGVRDFFPEESDNYVRYPELMHDLVSYIRRELVRLEKIPDEEIIEGDLSLLEFGSIRPPLGPSKSLGKTASVSSSSVRKTKTRKS